VATAGLERPRVLDLCTGTGDLAGAVLRASARASLFGADFSREMLRRAAVKEPTVRLVGMDALRLPFRNRVFDVVTVGFGVRNFSRREAAFAEVRRVLVPGGRFVILEFSPPPRGLLGASYRLYSRHILPRVAALVSRSKAAYRYLPASVDHFPRPEELTVELEESGFGPVNHESLAGGMVALHRAFRTTEDGEENSG
jgi:demethylmenaquinone methyltransferase/2-methoxy-6-polyprenyl-1,4-benzoquinol methylase